MKVAATPKHYAVHSGPEHARHQFDAIASDEDMRRTYLPAFKACVQEAKAESVMGAYNRTNGEPCCASPTLIEKILRQEWGFQGYVVSDCGAVSDIYSGHQVAADAAEAAALAVRNGCDLECGSAYAALGESFERGLVSEAEIDRAVRRLFRARFRLGMFDPPERVPFASIPLTVVDSTAHRSLALEAARQSLVLLKNEDGLLPLSKDLKRIAVIGPNADNPSLLLGNYNGMPSHIITPFHGILQHAGAGVMVDTSPGCGLLDRNQAALGRALELAEASELVIFVAGLSQILEGEEGQEEGVSEGRRSQGDRQGLELPDAQEELLKALHATGKPVVLVLLNGSPISLNWASEHIPAILEAWYPGQSGGMAIAEALFGDYNPGGRLPLTFYRSVADLPAFTDYAMRGRTYRYFQGPVTYPFGWGLSYTRFTYTGLVAERQEGTIRLQVTVQNRGEMAGDEVVQLYVRCENAPAGEPVHELRGFQRLHIHPGEARTVVFELDPAEFHQPDCRWQAAVGGRQPTLAEWQGDQDFAIIAL
ncbi:MAG: glycoside hydrolase family 3 C-terminal domain-containing protein [Anaerolineales bacterium]|nr:glycoside hydrolase family 3 C-terminal domain-containing protein [Anaerolineales bacterium]